MSEMKESYYYFVGLIQKGPGETRYRSMRKHKDSRRKRCEALDTLSKYYDYETSGLTLDYDALYKSRKHYKTLKATKKATRAERLDSGIGRHYVPKRIAVEQGIAEELESIYAWMEEFEDSWSISEGCYDDLTPEYDWTYWDGEKWTGPVEDDNWMFWDNYFYA